MFSFCKNAQVIFEKKSHLKIISSQIINIDI